MIYSKPISRAVIYGYIALSVLVSAAYGAQPYIMAGESTVNLIGTGAWYIDELPHRVDTRSMAWSIGLRGESWRLGYIDFGKAEVDARAYYPDSAYSPGEPRGCPSKGCAPENRYRGTFRTDGLFASYEPRWGIFTAGAGVAVLRHRGTVTVTYDNGHNPYLPDGYPQAGQKIVYDVNCNGASTRCAAEIQLTYLLTAGIEGKRWSLTAQSLPNAFGTGGISKGINTVLVGYKF